MGEPWATLFTAAIPSIIVAWIAHRAAASKERWTAEGAERSRIDQATRDLFDRLAADNARLRTENAELATAMSYWASIARRWCDNSHEMRHGRAGDRQLAEAHMARLGMAAIEWAPLPELPGFEAITERRGRF